MCWQYTYGFTFDSFLEAEELWSPAHRFPSNYADKQPPQGVIEVIVQERQFRMSRDIWRVGAR
jgi:hypothetical protein